MNNISLSIITTSLMLIFGINTLYSQSDHRVIDNISVEDSDTLITEPDDLEVPLEPSVEDSDTLIVGPDDSEVLLEPLKPRTKYSVGLNVSLPQISDFWTIVHSGPYVGIVVSRPDVFDLGSFSVGVGAGVEILNMGVENADYTGFYLSIESAIYETPFGPISVSGAGRLYNSIKDILYTLEPFAAATSAAIMFDYAVPGQPMVIQPYVRETLFIKIEEGAPASYLISIGATIHYDISTLF